MVVSVFIAETVVRPVVTLMYVLVGRVGQGGTCERWAARLHACVGSAVILSVQAPANTVQIFWKKYSGNKV